MLADSWLPRAINKSIRGQSGSGIPPQRDYFNLVWLFLNTFKWFQC